MLTCNNLSLWAIGPGKMCLDVMASIFSIARQHFQVNQVIVSCAGTGKEVGWNAGKLAPGKLS